MPDVHDVCWLVVASAGVVDQDGNLVEHSVLGLIFLTELLGTVSIKVYDDFTSLYLVGGLDVLSQLFHLLRAAAYESDLEPKCC